MESKKYELLLKHSNPDEVIKKLNLMFGKNNYQLSMSDVKNKKYRIKFLDTGEVLNFGDIFYQDYTKHKDEERRLNFKTRNKKWKYYPKRSSAFLSYYILW
jgi:hypothetical protein